MEKVIVSPMFRDSVGINRRTVPYQMNFPAKFSASKILGCDTAGGQSPSISGSQACQDMLRPPFLRGKKQKIRGMDRRDGGQGSSRIGAYVFLGI